MLEAATDLLRFPRSGNREAGGAALEGGSGTNIRPMPVAVRLHNRAELGVAGQLARQVAAVALDRGEVYARDGPLGRDPYSPSTSAARASARVTMPASRPSPSTTGKWLW